MKTKVYPNGTEFSDEAWKNWYGVKSSSELFEEEEERREYEQMIEEENEIKVDQAREDIGHNHSGIRR
ncbi:MAG: hypothetical protein ACRDFB_08630 [Rhabdochlamydiaceae bacterium]